jgi:transcriptional regulator with XRE-family HTH domain
MEDNTERQEFRKLIGSKIAEIRTERGLDHAKLSEESGLSIGAIKGLENGKFAVDADILFRLKDVLKFDLVFETY